MTISQIDSVAPASLSSGLIGSSPEEPRPDQAADTYGLDVAGWALGRHSPVVNVEIYAGRLKLLQASVLGQRPDIAELHPELQWAPQSGFRAAVSLLGFPGPFEFPAVGSDGQRSALGAIKGRRAALPSACKGGSLALPLLVTTLGRSGSAWFMRLLGRHPQFVPYKPFERDPRVAAYWFGVLEALAHPASYLLPLSAPRLADPRWWLDNRHEPPPEASRTGVQTWFGRENIESSPSSVAIEAAGCMSSSCTRSNVRRSMSPRKCHPTPCRFWPGIASHRGSKLSPCETSGTCSAPSSHPRTATAQKLSVATRLRATRNMSRSCAALRRTCWTLGRCAVKAPCSYATRPLSPALSPPCGECLRFANSIILMGSLRAGMVSGDMTNAPEERSHRTVEEPLRSVGRLNRDVSPSLQTLCEECRWRCVAWFWIRVLRSPNTEGEG